MPEVNFLFTQGDLDTIKKTVKEAEKHTSGEIRVKIIRRYDQDISDLMQQALREFEREGLHSTKDKTGVLVLVVLDERKFVILGDSGIYSRLSQRYWNNLASRMTLSFQVGNYASGICRIVEEVGRSLSVLFPHKADDINELSNEVILGK